MDKIKILCAEDDLLTRLEIKEKMEAKGWEVIEAGDGVEAFTKYKQCKPDLIILDVDMPKCTGLEVVKVIRANDLFTPIVIYSSLSDNKDMEAGFVNGAKVYFTKNYSVDNLLCQVENLIPDKSVEVIALAIGISYNFTSAELKINERCEKLSSKVNKVFAVLCKNRNKLCQRDLLLDAGWGNTKLQNEPQLNKVIGVIRQKLKGIESVKIALDRGNGYCLKTK